MAPSQTQIDSFELTVDVYNNYFAQKSPVNVVERWRKVNPALGKGASGEVWHVQEDKGAKRSRALKIIKNSAKLDQAEIESLITLNEYERHFTRFSGWWKTDDDLYLLTELMPGGDLGKYIDKFSPDENTYLDETQAKKIAKKLLEATAIMHSRGIIHRDLKPSNILLATENKALLDVRIADMGISKTIANKNNTMRTGTYGYMAPELFASGGEKYGLKVDIWSLGCVIFATLTGESPYPTYEDLPEATGDDTGFPTKKLELNGVSALGIKFIKSLVQVKADMRPTANRALDDRWLLGVSDSAMEIKDKAAVIVQGRV